MARKASFSDQFPRSQDVEKQLSNFRSRHGTILQSPQTRPVERDIADNEAHYIHIMASFHFHFWTCCGFRHDDSFLKLLDSPTPNHFCNLEEGHARVLNSAELGPYAATPAKDPFQLG